MKSRSSRGLGHHPFTVSTGVRIPYGTPSLGSWFIWRFLCSKSPLSSFSLHKLLLGFAILFAQVGLAVATSLCVSCPVGRGHAACLACIVVSACASGAFGRLLFACTRHTLGRPPICHARRRPLARFTCVRLLASRQQGAGSEVL